MKNLIVYTFLICLLFSCEEQMVVVPDFKIPVSDRVILLEELTGVSCPNCPKGSAKLDELIQLFPGKIVGVGIHGDLLTEPVSGSKYDFRTQFSQKIEESFGIFAKPCAVINRTHFPDQNALAIYDVDSWNTYVLQELEKEPKVDIVLSSAYSSSNRTATIDVSVIGREQVQEDLKISIVITENNIVDVQKDVSVVIEEFTHKHVLRTMLTEWSGNALGAGIDVGQNYSNTFSFEVPEEDGLWKIEDLEVVAFVSGPDGVLQAAQVHLSE